MGQAVRRLPGLRHGPVQKASDYFEDVNGGRFAFVSTNSIAQGQPVPALFGPLFDAGWRIRFAHQTFAWVSEAPGGANVHCVITGYDKHEKNPPMPYSYASVKGETQQVPARTINAYLIDGPNLLVAKRSKSLSAEIPKVVRGSQPTGGGNLIVEVGEYAKVAADPIAAKYLRPFRMGKELVRGLDRWCLWMADSDFDPRDIQRSPVLKERVEAARVMRLASKNCLPSAQLRPRTCSRKTISPSVHTSASRASFLKLAPFTPPIIFLRL